MPFHLTSAPRAAVAVLADSLCRRSRTNQPVLARPIIEIGWMVRCSVVNHCWSTCRRGPGMSMSRPGGSHWGGHPPGVAVMFTPMSLEAIALRRWSG